MPSSSVGNRALPVGLAAEVTPWSPATEVDVLARTRVGLYPVDRGHPLAEGKCGLKAILFMAYGVPPVVTPTTTNAKIVRDGVDGLHAEDGESWTAAVARLLDDAALWERCSAAAFERAREYSLQRWAPVLVERVLTLAERR